MTKGTLVKVKGAVIGLNINHNRMIGFDEATLLDIDSGRVEDVNMVDNEIVSDSKDSVWTIGAGKIATPKVNRKLRPK
jgi:hypothetical protein